MRLRDVTLTPAANSGKRKNVGAASRDSCVAGCYPRLSSRRERADAGGTGRAAAGGDTLRRCSRIFAADGCRRGKDARRSQGPPARIDRSPDRPAPRAHLQNHRGRHADRVRLGRRRRALRRRRAAGDGGSQRQSAGERAHPLAHRHQPRRRHGRRRRHVRRRRQCRGADRGARRTRRDLRQRLGARAGWRKAADRLRRYGRAWRQEHRAAGARLPRREGHRAAPEPRTTGRQGRSRCGRTDPGSRCCRSQI